MTIFITASLPIQAKAEKQSDSSSDSPFSTNSSSFSSDRGLAQEWEPSDSFMAYKQNYFLAFLHSSDPDQIPTSPNPFYQVQHPLQLQDKEVKFQISLKHLLAEYKGAGALWVGYTQLAFWQLFNQSTGQPFREVVYEPEVIYSLRPDNFSILNFGAVHQSNGDAAPFERSWNRLYFEPGIQINKSSDQRIILQMRWWIIEDKNDNPDIGDYQGFRELNLRYIQDGGWKINVMSRILSTQLDIAAPLSVWMLQPVDRSSRNTVDFHLQYFNGYGEGLLEYNQSHTSLGVGLSFPF